MAIPLKTEHHSITGVKLPVGAPCIIQKTAREGTLHIVTKIDPSLFFFSDMEMAKTLFDEKDLMVELLGA